jgi:thiosulfate reductase cytochrome b subunit
MARAYSGVLGAVALSLAITRGLVLGLHPNEILSQSLVVFFGFAFIGYWIGFTAEKTVCDSVENRFRREMAGLHSAAASQSKSLDN